MQDAGEMGNAVKILSMRLRGMKGELEDIGEEYENVESISKIQTQILNRTKGTVNIFDDAGNFRSTYEIIQGIAKVWNDISQVDQASLLEVIAGKQRGNSIAALIQSFQSGQTQKALEAAQNSAGSAMEEQDRWMQSIEAKQQQLIASAQEFSNTFLSSSLVKGSVDGLNLIVGGLTDVTKLLGTIPTLATIAFGAMGAKGYGKQLCFKHTPICPVYT